MPNRLAGSTSPYLLQHKDNPIDWYPWGDEAFQRAKLTDRPVLLSIGYSSCHWCHVMAHESFEDPQVGEFINAYFVAIKVDREELPEVDETYMTAVQLSSGRGGWPMTLFLTPDRKPFFAGTYFPKTTRGGFPGFVEIASGVAQAWQKQRSEIEKSASEFAVALRQALSRSAPPAEELWGHDLLAAALGAAAEDFDEQNGGFGPAPKFPPHAALRFLLELREGDVEAVEAAHDIALFTLGKICFGGIRDHVGGGFHRYATDAIWLLPHFEKMLYDNAQLLAALSQASPLAPTDWRSVLQEASQGIVDWLDREMTGPSGLFYSALDADSEGEEGKFYVWSCDEVRAVLGERAEAFLEAYGFQEGGNYHDEATREKTGMNIPHLATGDLGFGAELEALRTARERRVRPGLDHKAIAAWNGMMAEALYLAGHVAPARRCLDAWLAAERENGALPHQITDGRCAGAAYLDDYACLVIAMAADPDARFRADAERLADQMMQRFQDSDGAFFATFDRHEQLFGRTKPALDNATPSGNGLAALALLAVGRRAEAERAVRANLGWIQRAPTATETLLRAALSLIREAPETPSQAEAPVPPKPTKVAVSLAAQELPTQADGWATGEVVLHIPEGMHVNSNNPPMRWLKPTELLLQPGGEVDYPPAAGDEYVGTVRIPFRVRKGEFEVTVRFQCCTETECLEPEEKRFDGVAF